MTCANPACGAESNYLRSGAIFAVDFPGGSRDPGEGQIVQRRVIWLCDTCTGIFTVETWRPPGEQVRPYRSARTRSSRTRYQQPEAESWS